MTDEERIGARPYRYSISPVAFFNMCRISRKIDLKPSIKKSKDSDEENKINIIFRYSVPKDCKKIAMLVLTMIL